MSTDRLSPLDASFLHIEDDVSHMHIASVAIFEGPQPAFQEIVAMVDAKLGLVPRYRQVVKFVPLELGRPVWVDDPHFNIEYHLRHTALPTPGGEVELRKLVGRVMSQQLDRSKSLWEIWVVEGLEDGQWAMLSKTHHAMVDGVAGTDLLAVIMDLSPEVDPPRGRPVAPTTKPQRHPVSHRRPAQCDPFALRATPGGSSQHAGAATGCGLRQGRGQWCGRHGRTGARHPRIELERSHRSPSTVRLGFDLGQRHQEGAQGVGGHLQRCRPGLHHQWLSRATDLPR